MRRSVCVVGRCVDFYSDPVAAFDGWTEAREWATETLGAEMHGTGSREDPLGPNWTIKCLTAEWQPAVDVVGHRREYDPAKLRRFEEKHPAWRDAAHALARRLDLGHRPRPPEWPRGGS